VVIFFAAAGKPCFQRRRAGRAHRWTGGLRLLRQHPPAATEVGGLGEDGESLRLGEAHKGSNADGEAGGAFVPLTSQRAFPSVNPYGSICLPISKVVGQQLTCRLRGRDLAAAPQRGRRHGAATTGIGRRWDFRFPPRCRRIVSPSLRRSEPSMASNVSTMVESLK
jgi:hypothetical protein